MCAGASDLKELHWLRHPALDASDAPPTPHHCRRERPLSSNPKSVLTFGQLCWSCRPHGKERSSPVVRRCASFPAGCDHVMSGLHCQGNHAHKLREPTAIGR